MIQKVIHNTINDSIKKLYNIQKRISKQNFVSEQILELIKSLRRMDKNYQFSRKQIEEIIDNNSWELYTFLRTENDLNECLCTIRELYKSKNLNRIADIDLELSANIFFDAFWDAVKFFIELFPNNKYLYSKDFFINTSPLYQYHENTTMTHCFILNVAMCTSNLNNFSTLKEITKMSDFPMPLYWKHYAQIINYYTHQISKYCNIPDNAHIDEFDLIPLFGYYADHNLEFEVRVVTDNSNNKNYKFINNFQSKRKEDK